MVITLTRSDSFGATGAKQENPLPTDPPKLLSFLVLYDKIKRKSMLQYSSAERFVPRDFTGQVDGKAEFHSEQVCSFYPRGMVARIERRPSHCDRLLRRCRISRKTQQSIHDLTSFKEGEMLGLVDELKKEFATIK